MFFCILSNPTQPLFIPTYIFETKVFKYDSEFHIISLEGFQSSILKKVFEFERFYLLNCSFFQKVFEYKCLKMTQRFTLQKG